MSTRDRSKPWDVNNGHKHATWSHLILQQRIIRHFKPALLVVRRIGRTTSGPRPRRVTPRRARRRRRGIIPTTNRSLVCILQRTAQHVLPLEFGIGAIVTSAAGAGVSSPQHRVVFVLVVFRHGGMSPEGYGHMRCGWGRSCYWRSWRGWIATRWRRCSALGSGCVRGGGDCCGGERGEVPCCFDAHFYCGWHIFCCSTCVTPMNSVGSMVLCRSFS